MRLDGSDQRRGNVQVCINSTWWAICGQGNSRADNNLASVVCSELGYSQYGMLAKLLLHVYNIHIGAKSIVGLWYNYELYNFFNIHCNGNESSIFGCQYTVTTGTCSSYSAIGVVCSHSQYLCIILQMQMLHL